VQIALIVPTNELAILGDGNVTLDDACAHLDRRHVRLVRVLGELLAGSSVPD
jgi:hypothetical protein